MIRVPFVAVIAAMLAVSAVACSPATVPDGVSEDEERMDDLERRRNARLGGERPLPERLPPQSQAEVRGEVPTALLAAIDADLAGRLGIAPGEAQVVIAEARQWNDGSLGCPKPGVMYTQAIVPGYRVVLEHSGTRYDYRATEQGHFILCDAPALPGPAGVTR